MRLCTPGCGQCAVVWPQCFCVEARSGKRDLMGYIMLDLRMARTAKPIETVSQSGCACLLLVHLPRPLPTPRLAAGMRCSTLSTKNTNLSYTLQLPWRPHSLTPPPSALLPLFQHVRHLTHVAPWGHSTSRTWLPGVTPPHARGSLVSLHLTHVAPWGHSTSRTLAPWGHSTSRTLAPWGHSTSRMWLPGVTPPDARGSLGSLHLTHVAPWGHSTSHMWLPGVTPPHACGSLGSLHLTHVAPWGHSTSRMWLPGVTPPHACGSLGSLHLTHVAPWGHSTSRMWLPGVTPPHACGSLGSLHLTHVAPWGHSTSRMWLPGVTPPHACGSLGSLHLTHVAPWGHSTSRMWLPGVTPPHACGSLGSLHLTHVAPWGHSTSRMWLPGVTPPHARGSLGSLHLTTLCTSTYCPHTSTHTLTPTPSHPPPVSDDPSHLSLVLDEEQGYYILRPQGAGPQDPGQLDIFIVSLMLSGVKDLLQVCEAGVRGEGCGPLPSTPSRWCP